MNQIKTLSGQIIYKSEKSTSFSETIGQAIKEGISLDSANLDFSIDDDIDFNGVSLHNASIRWIQDSFILNFSNCDIRGVDFGNSDLSNCVFTNAIFDENTRMSDVTVSPKQLGAIGSTQSSVQARSQPRMQVIITPSKSPGMQEHTVELLKWINTYNKSK